MNRWDLRYKISSWDQVRNCLSNTCKELYLRCAHYTHNDVLTGTSVSVNHPLFGVLFCAMVEGSGSAIARDNSDGSQIRWLSNSEIINQLARFGFFIELSNKLELPDNVISYLSSLLSSGYDKITKLGLYSNSGKAEEIVVAIKSSYDLSLTHYGLQISQVILFEAMKNCALINVTNNDSTDGYQWEWLTYTANIADVLNDILTD